MKLLMVLALIGATSALDFKVITAEQAELVQSAWSKVKHNEVDILYHLFKAYPDIQAHFSKFAGKSLESIKDSAAFALHATCLFSFFTEVVDLMEIPATKHATKTLLNELGHNHKGRGITKEQFNDFRAAVTSYVSANAPWGENVAAAWNQAFDNNYEVVFASLDGNPVT